LPGHVAAGVAAKAGPGVVLVSRTVRDLVARSGIRCRDHGRHVLKGVPGKFALYAALAD
jgi:class 3 adenylate cyclase